MLLSSRLLAPVLVLCLHPATDIPPARGVETPAEEAMRISKVMVDELLEAQKVIVKKFRALPDSDDIRMHFGKNIYGWSVSEKSLSSKKEECETALATYQKDFKETSLVDELRLYAKKTAKEATDSIPLFEARLVKAQKELADGKFTNKEGKVVELVDADKKTREGLLRILPLEIELQKEIKRIATLRGAGITKLMDKL